MKNTIIKLTILFFLLQGCASVKDVKIESQNTLEASSLSKLEGTYENMSHTSSNKYDHFLWHAVTGRGLSRRYWDNSKVKIDIINHEKIQLSLIDSLGKTVKRYRRKGRLENGCFQPKRKFLIVPLPPVVFGYSNEISKLCLSDDQLHLVHAWNIWGFALIAGTKSKGSWTSQHQKMSR